MSERIRTVGELKNKIKDLPNELPIDCEVHKLSGDYYIDSVYRCGNDNGEPILIFYIKWCSK